MIAQPSRRADDDMAAVFERTRLAARVHSADAGCDPRACGAVKPDQFALNLHGEFARWRDDQRQGRAGGGELLIRAEQRVRQGQSISDRLAGAGLRGHEQVAPFRFGRQHGFLHGGEFGVALSDERALEQRMDGRERHRVDQS